MKKTTLIGISAARDLLDVLVVGMIPGLNWVLNAPLIYLHYRFAVPRALITLVENIPVVEAFPCFTAAALSYPDLSHHHPAQEPQPEPDARPEHATPVLVRRTQAGDR